jgi:hypothetical protein
MAKLCMYITTEHYRTLNWHMKTTGKSMAEVATNAIDWFDPEIHGPFVFGSFNRVSRMIEIPPQYTGAIETYSEGYGISTTKTMSTIIWLYLGHHSLEMMSAKVDSLPSLLPLNLHEDLYEQVKDEKNLSSLVSNAIVHYVNEGMHKTHRVSASKEKGVHKHRVNVYLSKDANAKLLEAVNTMRNVAPLIAADALAEYRSGGDDAPIF